MQQFCCITPYIQIINHPNKKRRFQSQTGLDVLIPLRFVGRVYGVDVGNGGGIGVALGNTVGITGTAG